MITSLKENEIFVFGSNYAGIHGGGAARQAMEDFGAEYGIGEGLTGQCYAFPTLDSRYGKRSYEELNRCRDRLFSTARALPEKTFLLTALGTGIAGYEVEEMKPLFTNGPSNIVLPKEFL
jgi:hypothetical protein